MTYFIDFWKKSYRKSRRFPSKEHESFLEGICNWCLTKNTHFVKSVSKLKALKFSKTRKVGRRRRVMCAYILIIWCGLKGVCHQLLTLSFDVPFSKTQNGRFAWSLKGHNGPKMCILRPVSIPYTFKKKLKFFRSQAFWLSMTSFQKGNKISHQRLER